MPVLNSMLSENNDKHGCKYWYRTLNYFSIEMFQDWYGTDINCIELDIFQKVENLSLSTGKVSMVPQVCTCMDRFRLVSMF